MAALTDRVAVITGASSGIGAGLAAMLAAEGARVVLAARRGDERERVAAGIRQAGGSAVPVVTDLADENSLAGLFDRARTEVGPVDVLVNNAGFAVWKPLEATTLAEWDHTFAVTVRAAACLCAAVLPGMQARRFGRVINIGSEAGAAIVPGLIPAAVEEVLRAPPCPILARNFPHASHGSAIRADGSFISGSSVRRPTHSLGALTCARNRRSARLRYELQRQPLRSPPSLAIYRERYSEPSYCGLSRTQLDILGISRHAA